MTIAALTPADTVERQEYAVQIEGLTCSFGGVPAIRNLTFHVPSGSVYALVGPRASGKTTILRVLATLQHATGRIRVAGIDPLSNPAAVRGHIGYLSDAPGMYDGLTAAEYLDFYGSIYHISARRRSRLTDELLELVDLARERARPVGSLSRCMRQQLNLARCLIHDPDILLLDDPFSHLDARARIELHDLLLELSKLGKTIVLTSRTPADVSELCSHIAVLNAGRLLLEGPTDELITGPTSALRLRIRLLNAEHRLAAAQLLRTHPLCHTVEDAGDTSLLVSTTGSERDLPALLQHIESARIGVMEFALDRDALTALLLQAAERDEQP